MLTQDRDSCSGGPWIDRSVQPSCAEEASQVRNRPPGYLLPRVSQVVGTIHIAKPLGPSKFSFIVVDFGQNFLVS
jgi:hypothetical protein